MLSVIDELRSRSLVAIGTYRASPHLGYVLMADFNGDRMRSIRLRPRDVEANTDGILQQMTADLDLPYDGDGCDIQVLSEWIRLYRHGG